MQKFQPRKKPPAKQCERLKELRSEKGITQKQLAAQLNVSGNTVHAWECDLQEPSTTVLKEISAIFNVSPDYLFGKTDC